MSVFRPGIAKRGLIGFESFTAAREGATLQCEED
jgi:hypothetical protein